MNLLIQPFYGFIPADTPPDDLGATVVRITDEMLSEMASRGYRRSEPGELRPCKGGFLLVFHGEPMGWCN